MTTAGSKVLRMADDDSRGHGGDVGTPLGVDAAIVRASD